MQAERLHSHAARRRYHAPRYLRAHAGPRHLPDAVGNMSRLFLLLALAGGLVALGSASAAKPRSAAPAPYAGQCGVPATQPVWFEFGQPYLQPVFGQAGIAVGASTGDWPAQMRQLGAATVYFDLNL